MDSSRNIAGHVRIDMHLHTTCSDGVLTPDQLFDEIRAAQLDFFCVSDHDTMAAYPLPPDLRDRAIPGLEIDSELNGHTVHLLGYGVAPDSPVLGVLGRQRADRHSRMEMIVAKLSGLGYPIELSDVTAQAGNAASLGRPHLARALVARGIVASVQEAFDKFLADGGPAFVPLERLSAGRIIELVHLSGGLAVIAHPKRLREEGDLMKLVDLGVDGIEVCHPTADEAYRREMREFAAERGMFTTGGTDFHAPSDAGIQLGVVFERDAIDPLLERLSISR